jgi:hypothetical protein
MASDDDDPRAPYKVYEGDECKGNYPTRAEARRAQQRLESEATGSEPPRNFIIMDNLERVVALNRSAVGSVWREVGDFNCEVDFGKGRCLTLP